ncbi:MAG: LPXTG cell wall anchor domain-containing protein, partial [Clostridium sp.]|nr:LPXTG cell wall anchor domain-containing protein [Clostridium sp.]
NIMVIFNANDTDVEIPLYNGDLDWEIVVNGEKAGVESLGSIKGSEGSIVVPAHTSYVLVDKASYEASIAEDKPSDDNNNSSVDDNNNNNNNPSVDDNNNSSNTNNSGSSNTPSKTGDSNNIILVLALVLVSATGVIVFSRKKKIS